MAPLRISYKWHTVTSILFISILASHIHSGPLLVHAAPAEEKESKASKAADGIDVFLQSWEWATFGITVVAEFFAIVLIPTTIQALSRYFTNKRKREPPAATGLWNTGGWFCAFTIMASIFLASFYPLYLVQNLAPEIWDTGSITHSLIPSGMMILSEDMVDITILCAFFSLLHRRQSVFFPETLSTLKTILKVALILVMIIVTAVKSALACMLSTYESKSRFESTIDLFHVFVAFYIVATFALIVSAFLMERKLEKAGLEDQLISTTMIRRVCPLLGAQALFRLADDIISNLPLQKAQHINYDALTLFEIAVKFIACTFSLLFGIRNFFPGQAILSYRHE